jgi:hypothetical protein
MHRNSLAQIQKQLTAMNCAEYEIGALDDQDGKPLPTGKLAGRMHLRPKSHWDREEGSTPPEHGLTGAEILTRDCNWLSFMNTKGGAKNNGCHIFIRPFGQTDLTFVDDLTKETVEKMSRDGYRFAVLIESSPNNFHGWLRNARPLTNEEQTVAAKILAERYGGDMNSAAHRHFGRIAGFTNCKEKYFDQNLRGGIGGYPFVQLRDSNGRVFERATDFLSQIHERVSVHHEQIQQARQQRESLPCVTANPNRIKTLNYFYATLGPGELRRTADIRFAVNNLSNGVSEAEVAHILRTQSQSSSNQGGDRRSKDYAQRTIDKAKLRCGMSQPQHHSMDLGR